MFKIMTLNLWGYHDWENRKDNILKVIKDYDADIIALQEVLTNHEYSDYPSSDFLAHNTDYKYKLFSPTFDRLDAMDKDGQRTQRCSYGKAILSKYPITSSESYFLKQYPDNNEPRTMLFCHAEIEGKTVHICNVHFANSDKHSKLHLKELMDLCARRKVKPIILGDFNIYDLGTQKKDLMKGYTLSTDSAEYMSMPGDNGTLDYIAVPSDSYELQDVICPDAYVSDHRPVIAHIKNL